MVVKQLMTVILLFGVSCLLVTMTEHFGCADLITVGSFQLVAAGMSVLVLIYGQTDTELLGMLVLSFGGFLGVAGAAWAPRFPMMMLMVFPGMCLMLSGKSLALGEE